MHTYEALPCSPDPSGHPIVFPISRVRASFCFWKPLYEDSHFGITLSPKL